MSNRIYYTTNLDEKDHYAMRTEKNQSENDYEIVARSIARKRGLSVCAGPASEGESGTTRCYRMALGIPDGKRTFSVVRDDVQFWITGREGA